VVWLRLGWAAIVFAHLKAIGSTGVECDFAEPIARQINDGDTLDDIIHLYLIPKHLIPNNHSVTEMNLTLIISWTLPYAILRKTRCSRM